MERQKIINNLQEWQSKDRKNRAFILIISERKDEDNTEGTFAACGTKRMISASLASSMMEQTKIFREATRILLDSPLEEEEEETDKDTNAYIN